MDKLKAHVERWRNNSDSARLSVKLGDLRELISRLESAEKSLMPFAKAPDIKSASADEGLSGYWADIYNENSTYSLKLGHLRAARAHMEKYHGR